MIFDRPNNTVGAIFFPQRFTELQRTQSDLSETPYLSESLCHSLKNILHLTDDCDRDIIKSLPFNVYCQSNGRNL
jgi:hypothetical protein